MEHKKAFFIMAIVMHLFPLFVLLAINQFKFNIFLSFEIAFFSFLIVIFSSYLNYKKIVFSKAKKYEYFQNSSIFFLKKIKKLPKNIKFRVIKDDLDFNFKDKIYFFTTFFSLLKIFAYMVLVAGFLFLHRQNLLNIFGYLCGISALLICVFIFIVYIRYESKKNY
ncbi:hypothetical protein [Campylobacter estrildidarum]|uniref:hypothetical protein n=1 Tax=Campylobacter estrildidarum TaxID=2510189 RepID=UPI001FEAF2EC|nr:hypothetical protein [Campylobacter estrildidarum]